MRRKLLVSCFVLAAVFATALASSGCQTVKGAGEDIQNLGEAGERAINND